MRAFAYPDTSQGGPALDMQAARALEARTVTDDGYIWPLTRENMASRGPIRERMLEDIRALVHDGGADAVVTLADLGRKGWTPEQVIAHGVAAFQAFRAENQKGWKKRRFRRAAGTGIEAAALLLFLGNLWLWAGLAAGAI